MATDPLLFDLEPSRPTTRTIARLVKEGGTAALPDAVRRSDNATYQAVTCRSALNRVEGMPFRWTLNPYRGCTHGCHYCFARRYQSQLELDPDDQFSSVILVKTNFADVLRQELARRSWKRELVALGTATDPYQPIEGRYKLTRRSLEDLRDSATPVGLVTNGPMAVRTRPARCAPHPRLRHRSWAMERMYVPRPHSTSRPRSGGPQLVTPSRYTSTSRASRSTSSPALARS